VEETKNRSGMLPGIIGMTDKTVMVTCHLIGLLAKIEKSTLVEL
jgi:hypothetical protein